MTQRSMADESNWWRTESAAGADGPAAGPEVAAVPVAVVGAAAVLAAAADPAVAARAVAAAVPSLPASHVPAHGTDPVTSPHQSLDRDPSHQLTSLRNGGIMEKNLTKKMIEFGELAMKWTD